MVNAMYITWFLLDEDGPENEKVPSLSAKPHFSDSSRLCGQEL